MSTDRDELAAETPTESAEREGAMMGEIPEGQPPALGTPQNPVDGTTHPCEALGYRFHTAVGAGAISSPYLCHGCGTWFTLPSEEGTNV